MIHVKDTRAQKQKYYILQNGINVMDVQDLVTKLEDLREEVDPNKVLNDADVNRIREKFAHIEQIVNE